MEMDATAFLEAVRESNATALDRLGSERSLVAATRASLDRATVLERAAESEARAAATFAAWAGDEADGPARAAFADAAEAERAHLRQVCELGGGPDPDAVADPPADALHEHLRGLAETVPRVAAGLVARPLVASRTLLQVVNFFVNEADRGAAETFRELRSETDEQATAGAETLVAVCTTDADRRRAAGAADDAVAAAYDEYAETLAGLGIDPKPVC